MRCSANLHPYKEILQLSANPHPRIFEIENRIEMVSFCGIGSWKMPDSGAIFMCNRSTKAECLGRKLLGLPSSFAHFVKHVRAGMLLFLFEHERRLLYGVFEAVSDGSIDIVPHAYQSSGKKFPAQVRFNVFWNCPYPIPESSFRDAIRDNYFSPQKFHFGLEREQVLRLLLLFDTQRVIIPQRDLLVQKAVSFEETTHPDSKSASPDVKEHEESDNGTENTVALPSSETDDDDGYIPLSSTQSSDSEDNVPEVAATDVSKGLYCDDSAVRKSVFSRLKVPAESEKSNEIKKSDPAPGLKRKRTTEGNVPIEAVDTERGEALEGVKEKMSKWKASALSRLAFPLPTTRKPRHEYYIS